jgi:hypothetical protein
MLDNRDLKLQVISLVILPVIIQQQFWPILASLT